MADPGDEICCAAAGLITPPAPPINSNESNSSTRPSLPTVACHQHTLRKSLHLPTLCYVMIWTRTLISSVRGRCLRAENSQVSGASSTPQLYMTGGTIQTARSSISWGREDVTGTEALLTRSKNHVFISQHVHIFNRVGLARTKNYCQGLSTGATPGTSHRAGMPCARSWTLGCAHSIPRSSRCAPPEPQQCPCTCMPTSLVLCHAHTFDPFSPFQPSTTSPYIVGP